MNNKMPVVASVMLTLTIWVVATAYTATKNKQPEIPGADAYQLVWADEFNRDGPPDSSAWRFENGFVRNEELQWYQDANAYCKNGLLVIEGRRERRTNPLYEEGSTQWRKRRPQITYISSSINTSGKRAWKYGRFVMRGRIPISNGLWPAWWTLGIDKPWPANGEIDIMEYYNHKVLANIACLGADNRPEWFSKTKGTDTLGGLAWADRFHIWRMDWTEDAISLYLDDLLLNRVEVGRLYNKDGSAFNPFTQPHYMLLNLAIGGMNGGDPSATEFPSKFEVDYVRVYQQRQNKN